MDEDLHKHGLWLYGIILSLAIKEALTHVAPHVFNPPAGDARGLIAEFGRLLLFLFLSVRFYLRAVRFFQRAYNNPDSDERYKTKSFPIDFLFGFCLFLFFFGCALSIDVSVIPHFWFPLLVALILFWDLPWCFALRHSDTRHLIKMWAFVNMLTLVVGLLIYFIVRPATDPRIAEWVAYIPIVIASGIDLAELTGNRELFSEGLRKLLPE